MISRNTTFPTRQKGQARDNETKYLQIKQDLLFPRMPNSLGFGQTLLHC